MKIKSLKLENFMRYRGIYELEFSCDSEKNVTVVIGDNTFGKTTLAQAFRWGLYGSIINTQYNKNTEVCLLNNDILSDMGPNDRANVIVTIVLTHKESDYEIIRKQTFSRKYPHLETKSVYASLELTVKDLCTGETDVKNVDEAMEIIQELFPQDLSQYFFFDGERWREDKNKTADIKKSVHNLMGLSAVKNMMNHLKDNRYNVVSAFKNTMKGDNLTENYFEEKIKELYEKIDKSNQEIKAAEDNVVYFDSKVKEIEEILDSNKRIEEEQKEVKHLENQIKHAKRYLEEINDNIVSNFSSMYKVFAIPLLEQIVEALKEVDLEGKDIPHIKASTIQYLIEKKECLCGCKLEEGTKELEKLLHLMSCVPPKAIGGIVGDYEKTIKSWSYDNEKLREHILEKCDVYMNEDDDLSRLEQKLVDKNQIIDKKINFESERRRLQDAKKQAISNRAIINGHKENIENYKNKIKTTETELLAIQAQNKKNEKAFRNIKYAEALYMECKNIFERNEKIIIQELNELIRKNYEIMFNEKEKYAALDDKFDIKLFYKTIRDGQATNAEVTGLSEGEKIARNFVFIVSIMELAKMKKVDNLFDTQELPIVLDGPFSKLSATNTELISSVLPNISEQVIVFTLDKDWQHTKLDDFVGRKYEVTKESNEISSKLVKIM